MVVAKFSCGDIAEWNNTRLTRRVFKSIQESLIYDAMTSDEHDALAEVEVYSDFNSPHSRYIITIDTWQEFSGICGELNVFKDSLNNPPIYTRDMILAE